jgi:hypothetical protein
MKKFRLIEIQRTPAQTETDGGDELALRAETSKVSADNMSGASPAAGGKKVGESEQQEVVLNKLYANLQGNVKERAQRVLPLLLLSGQFRINENTLNCEWKDGSLGSNMLDVLTYFLTKDRHFSGGVAWDTGRWARLFKSSKIPLNLLGVNRATVAHAVSPRDNALWQPY